MQLVAKNQIIYSDSKGKVHRAMPKDVFDLPDSKVALDLIQAGAALPYTAAKVEAAPKPAKAAKVKEKAPDPQVEEEAVSEDSAPEALDDLV